MRLRQIVLRLIGLGVLALILLKLDLTALASALTGVRWGYLLLALLVNPLLFGIKSWRWREMLRMQAVHYPWRDAFLVFSAGLFLGLVTPGRLGEAGKALYLKQDQDLPLSEGLANVLMDRLLDLYCILLIGAVGLAWFRLLPSWALLLVLSATLFALLLPAVLLSERLADLGLSLLLRVPILRGHAAGVASAALQFRRGLRPLVTLGLVVPVGLTLAAYGLFFVQGRLLALALALPLSIDYVAVCLSVAGAISLLPISFSGLGTRDAILIALFAPLGLAAEQAVAFSTLFFLTAYVGGGALGALAWQIKPLREHRPSI